MSDNFDNRQPTDICLLCKRNDEDHKALATKKNSHITPMGLIQSNTGRRNHEATGIIDIYNTDPIKMYFGRSNLKNTNPVIGKDPHMWNFIFCPECETRLGEIEGEIIPILNEKLRDANQNANFPKTDLSRTVYFKEGTRIDPYKFKLLIYSVIWRQNLDARLHFSGQGILEDAVEEKLRAAIVSGLYNGTANNELIEDCFPFTLITAENFEDSGLHAINPHPDKYYPEVFCINDFIAFLYFKDDAENEESLISKASINLPKAVFDQELDIVSSEPIRICFISDSDFEKFQKLVWERTAKLRTGVLESEELKFALRNSVTGLSIIEDSDISFDESMTFRQRSVAYILLSLFATWIDVADRKLVRYKIINDRIPNRRGELVLVHTVLLELAKSDGSTYKRIGLYGNVD